MLIFLKKVYQMSQVAHQAAAYLSAFLKMTWLGVFLFPHERDISPSQVYPPSPPPPPPFSHLYTWVDRSTGRFLKCLAKVPRPGLDAEASVLNMTPLGLHFTRKGVNIFMIIMHLQFRLVFQFAGIVFSCYLGIGFGLGSMIGGFLVDIIGGSWTFLLSGGVTAIVLVLCVLSLAITKLLNRMKNNKVERETEDYESS